MKRALLVVPALIALSLSPYPASPSAGQCAAPSLSLQKSPSAGTAERQEVRRGEEVTVLGRGFVSGCDDSGGATSVFGCSGDDAASSEQPLLDLELVLLQGRPTPDQTPLASADAGNAAEGDLGQVSWTFTVPTDALLGRADLKTVASEPLPVRIVD